MEVISLNKKALIRSGIGIGIAVAALVCWSAADPPALENMKEISVYVYDGDGNYTNRELETRAQKLGQAMEESGLLCVRKTASGTIIEAVEDMLPADGKIWVYNINSEYSSLSPAEQPIEDGDMVAFYQITRPTSANGHIDWQTNLIGTWKSDSGETIEISEYRVRLVGTANLSYELSYDENENTAYMILSEDNSLLGNYTRLVCTYNNEAFSLFAQADGYETEFYKTES